MSFMAVAYVPAFLEDRATFAKERANGLYGATPFMVSNFLIGLPFLCKIFDCKDEKVPLLTVYQSLSRSSSQLSLTGSPTSAPAAPPSSPG